MSKHANTRATALLQHPPAQGSRLLRLCLQLITRRGESSSKNTSELSPGPCQNALWELRAAERGGGRMKGRVGMGSVQIAIPNGPPRLSELPLSLRSTGVAPEGGRSSLHSSAWRSVLEAREISKEAVGPCSCRRTTCFWLPHLGCLIFLKKI